MMLPERLRVERSPLLLLLLRVAALCAMPGAGAFSTEPFGDVKWNVIGGPGGDGEGAGEPFPHERCEWTRPDTYECQSGICYVTATSTAIACYYFDKNVVCVMDVQCAKFLGPTAEATDYLFGQVLWCLPESLPGCW